MTILLIDPIWHSEFLKQTENLTFSEATLKEIYASKNSNKDHLSLKKKGKTAIIHVIGPLTKTPDFFYMLFGDSNTAYDDIIREIDEMEGDDSIENAEMLFNTPGGDWIGLSATVMAIASAKKPIIAKIIGSANSAGYVLASQADKIISTEDSNEIGSIGVVTEAFDYEGHMKIIRSSHAKNKNPDAFTKEGEKEILKLLDSVEEKAVNFISEGRTAATGKKVTPEKIYSNYGQGSVFMADKALEKGMIDEIIPASKRISNSSNTASLHATERLHIDKSKKKEKVMDKKELKEENSGLYAEIIEEGRLLERDQAKGHIKMAESTGAVDFALKCIGESKSLHEQEVIAEYLSAGMKGKELKDREDDNPPDSLKTEKGNELSEEEQTKKLVADALSKSKQPIIVEA